MPNASAASSQTSPAARRASILAPLRWRRAGLLAPFILALAGATAHGWRVASAANTDPALEARQNDLTEVEQQAENIRRDLIDRQADRRALIDELEARERNVAELALANRELGRLVKEHTRIATELRGRQAEERQSLQEEIGLLSELLRTAYIMGRADRLRLLLNQEDPTHASRVMSYFAYFNRERMKRIQAVQQLAERLDGLARNAEEEASRLAELAKSQEATRARLEGARQERAQVLKQLEASIASRAETLEGLKSDADALKRLIEHLRQRAQIHAELNIQRDPFGTLKGKLAWPILENRVLASYGTRKEDSQINWDGVLLAAHDGRRGASGQRRKGDLCRLAARLRLADRPGPWGRLYDALREQRSAPRRGRRVGRDRRGDCPQRQQWRTRAAGALFRDPPQRASAESGRMVREPKAGAPHCRFPIARVPTIAEASGRASRFAGEFGSAHPSRARPQADPVERPENMRSFDPRQEPPAARDHCLAGAPRRPRPQSTQPRNQRS